MSDSVRPHRRQPTRLSHPWDSPDKNTAVGCDFFLQCIKVKSESEVAQSCPTLCDPMDCSLPGSSIHGIFQARVLEWVAISFSRGFSWPRDWTQVSCIAGRHFTIWATREVLQQGSCIVCYTCGELYLVRAGQSHERLFKTLDNIFGILFENILRNLEK